MGVASLYLWQRHLALIFSDVFCAGGGDKQGYCLKMCWLLTRNTNNSLSCLLANCKKISREKCNFIYLRLRYITCCILAGNFYCSFFSKSLMVQFNSCLCLLEVYCCTIFCLIKMLIKLTKFWNERYSQIFVALGLSFI